MTYIETLLYPMMVINKKLFGLEPEQFPDILFHNAFSDPFRWLGVSVDPKHRKKYTLDIHKKLKGDSIDFYLKTYKQDDTPVKFHIDLFNQNLKQDIADYTDYRHVLLTLVSYGLGYIKQPFIRDFEGEVDDGDRTFTYENPEYFQKSCELVEPFAWSILLFLQDHFCKYEKKVKTFNRPENDEEYDRRLFWGIEAPGRHPGINIDDIPRSYIMRLINKDTSVGVISSKKFRGLVRSAAFDGIGNWAYASDKNNPGRKTDTDYMD
jgi:hypothetical protein